MKKILVLLMAFGMMAGCSNITDRKQLTPNEEMCASLKNDITFSSSSGYNIGDASVLEQARTQNLYKKYDCDKLNNNK